MKLKNKHITIFIVLLAAIVLVYPKNCTSQQYEDSIYYSQTNTNTDSLNQEETTLVESGIDTSNQSPWLWKVNYFGKSFRLVNALTIITLVAVLVMIILLVLILLNRARIEREEKLKQYLLESYQTLILDYLFEDSNTDGFFEIASSDYRRQILIDTIIDISINLKGESGEKLKLLFLELNLNADSISKAYSKHWHIKIKGFKELAFMNLKDANEEIYHALQSKNHILRMEAQIALVRLSEEDPFEWLYFQIRPFSLWEQITLHSMMIQHDISPPSFSKWLDSPNYTVVLFALRMIREYHQHDDEDSIIEVVHHNHDKVRLLAIELCGDLKLKESALILKSRYRLETHDIKLEIVKSIGKMEVESMLPFLKNVLDKEGNVEIQIEATKAIEQLGDVGIAALNELMEAEYKNYKIVIRNVLDKKIV